jgi:Xaa-Pro aminopeptidase
MALIDRAALLQERLYGDPLAGAGVALPQHVYYLTGNRPGSAGSGHKPIPWGYWFFVLGPRKRLLVAPGTAEQLSQGLRPGVEVLPYRADSTEGVIREPQAAATALAQAVVAAGLERKRIGVEAAELGMGFGEVAGRSCEIVPLDAQIEHMRLRKDDEELDLIRRAVGIVDHGFEAARRTIRPCVTELEVYAAVYSDMLVQNGEPFILDVTWGSGPNTLGGLGAPSNRTLREGELFLMDMYPTFKMYKSDMTRLFVAGKPRDWQLKAHAVLAEAMRRAEQAVRPGVPASEPDAVARRCVAEAGYGLMPHHAGHGLGLMHPERPYLAPWEPLQLEERTVIAIEPGLIVPELGYMRIERNYVVRADGAECLSRFPCELYACG